MSTALKRRLVSSSSSDDSHRHWAATGRITRALPVRRRAARKVQRVASTHCVVNIVPSRQVHRSKEASFSEASDTEVSSSDTELGTALSDVESVIPSSKGQACGPASPDVERMELSTSEREGDEIDDSLGQVRMSASPSPGPSPVLWSSWDSKVAYEIPITQESGSSKVRDVRGDRKRRRVEFEQEMSRQEEDHADDEMDAESALVTPKQKVLRNRKLAGEKQAARTLAPTPSIVGLTARLSGLTPHSMEMQMSPDMPMQDSQPEVRLSRTRSLRDPSMSICEPDSEDDDDTVSAALVPSPSPPPRRHTRARFSRRRISMRTSASSHSQSRPLVHDLAAIVEQKQRLQEARERSWTACPIWSLPSLLQFKAFDLSDQAARAEAAAAAPTWSYGPLASPIRLVGESPRPPLTHRILLTSLPGQRTRPNKNLQRRSPTSLLPARRPKGRKYRLKINTQSHRNSPKLLPFAQPHPIVGQVVISHIHLAKEARLKRWSIMRRANDHVDYAKVCAMRAKCLASLDENHVWRSLLSDIAKDCWWWISSSSEDGSAATVDLASPPVADRIPSQYNAATRDRSEEIQVEALVANSAVQPALVQPVAVAQSSALHPARIGARVSSAIGRSAHSSMSHTRDRALRATAALRRRANERSTPQPGPRALSRSIGSPDEVEEISRAEAEAHHARVRAADRAANRRELGERDHRLESRTPSHTPLDPDVQRRMLGRHDQLERVPSMETVRHTSVLDPAWLRPTDYVEPIVVTRIADAGDVAPISADAETEIQEVAEATDTESEPESTISEPPAYDSASYPRHIPCPPHLRPRRSPARMPTLLPTYRGPNIYSRRSPSPPPPYNARTDRQTLVEPIFIGEDEEDAGEREVVTVDESEPDLRVVGAFPSSASAPAPAPAPAPLPSPDWAAARDRFDAAYDMEEADADLIDELTGGFETASAGQMPAGSSLGGVIGGFLGRWFGRR